MAPKKFYNKKELTKIISDYKKFLKKEGIVFSKVYLFGSYAKDKPREWSDIDLAVVSRKFGKDIFEEQLMLDRIADKVSYSIEAHPFHPKDLKNKWSSLAVEVNKHGRLV